MNTFAVRVCPVHLDDDKILYFEEQDDLESDSWRISGKCEKSQIFRNQEHLVLIAQPNDEDRQAIFDEVEDQKLSQLPGVRFNIHSYQDTNPRGLTVAFTVQHDSKTYYMYVEKRESNMRVGFKEGDLPKNIEGETSHIIFIKKRFSEGSMQFFKFESTLEQGYFLAFEDDVPNVKRLIVKKIDLEDEVDESTKLYHTN